MTDEMVSIGEALRRMPPRQDPVMEGASGEVMRCVVTKGGATIYLTAAEAAASGLRCFGVGEERRCQFGLWRDSRGEWVYPPEHDPTDLDGFRYREALKDLEQAHRVDMQSKRRQEKAPRYTQVDPFAD